ncbi:phosphotransferase [Mesomycoplasma lagogenitalium]|uniref:Phosphotransferase n=1 Tax=Mesomycoplasma lagogenitalium TaxID=171286 RepID=A0ABY8LWS0_9BACT|nr:phosphotransferase [Mesomycoplasma lagogenitalium]WGI36701.1 phosphotransferase [Mesomycoplasma lagogenitalium]
MKIKIEKGLTNNSYKDGQFFYQEKKKNSFNHRINYDLLSNLDFVPKMIHNNDKDIYFDWIEGKEIEVNDINLAKVAHLMKTLHNSKLDFPPSNHASRIKEYRKILVEKNIKIPVIDKYFKKINLILRNMKKDIPLHNDLWLENIIIDKNEKIWFVDWEYASKGDKHFDLAYFIESCRLSDEQETVFLNAYDDYDYEYVLQHRILVLYLTILWLHTFPENNMPFGDQEFIEKIDSISNKLEERQREWKKIKF